MLGLLLTRKPPHLLPAPAVAAGLVLRLFQPGCHLRIAFEGNRAGIEGDRDLELRDKTLDAPDARPRAVLEHGFHREVPVLGVHRIDDSLEAVAAPVAGPRGLMQRL